jgi:hypothetical protein
VYELANLASQLVFGGVNPKCPKRTSKLGYPPWTTKMVLFAHVKTNTIYYVINTDNHLT